MKNKILSFAKSTWSLLTEVPGWPDAPVRARVMRALPITLPVLGVMAILGWKAAVLQPRWEHDRAEAEPLDQLESEVAALKITASDQQVAQLAQQAEAAAKLLWDNPDRLPDLYRLYRTAAQQAGWDATFQALSNTDEPNATPSAPVRFQPIRVKLKPEAGNNSPLPTLLAALEGFSAVGKRIDLTSLSIRADDLHWQSVEVHLRLACSVPHAKTP